MTDFINADDINDVILVMGAKRAGADGGQNV